MKEFCWHCRMWCAPRAVSVKCGCICFCFSARLSENTSRATVWLSFLFLSGLIPILGLAGVFRAFLEAHRRFKPWALMPAFRAGILTGLLLATAATARSLG